MQALTTCTVVLEGVVTGAEERVAEALQRLRPGGALVLDARKATALEAVLLARLVRLLAQHRQPLTLRLVGLSRRDLQLLGYLGLPVEQSGPGITAALPLEAGA